MIDDNGASEELISKEVFHTTVSRDTLNSGAKRLNASSYSSEIVAAKKLIHETDREVQPLSELCEDVFRMSRFKRVWVDDAEHGYPYMAPKDLAMYKPRLRKRENPQKAFVSKHEYEDQFDDFSVEARWLLISCSGAIGRVFLATEEYEQYFFTHDLIRVIPKEGTLEGYLYAYLDSWVGQALLTQNEHGVTVDHIEPHQIEDLPVILPPDDKRQEIHETAVGAYKHREKFLKKDQQAVEETDALFGAEG